MIRIKKTQIMYLFNLIIINFINKLLSGIFSTPYNLVYYYTL